MGPGRYAGQAYDSSRWDGAVFRAGDVVACAPQKCGTTWAQMIGSLSPAPADSASALRPGGQRAGTVRSLVTRGRAIIWRALPAHDPGPGRLRGRVPRRQPVCERSRRQLGAHRHRLRVRSRALATRNSRPVRKRVPDAGHPRGRRRAAACSRHRRAADCEECQHDLSLDTLERRGLVERHRHPRDRRKSWST